MATRRTFSTHESTKKRLSFNSTIGGSAQRSNKKGSVSKTGLGSCSVSRSGSRRGRGGAVGIVSRRWSGTSGSQLKDPRNLSNRGLQRQMADAIWNSLQEHGYPQQITQKTLQAPTSKDFVRIFEFLIGLLIPNTKIEKKIEEEIPKLLKQIKYPFPISKSTMFTIGSLHTWPTLLGALHYLTELITYSERGDISEIMFPSSLDIEEEGAAPSSGSEILFKYYESTYEEWLIYEREDFSQEDAMLTQAILTKTGVSQEDHDALTDEISELEDELAQLESEPDSLQEALEIKSYLESENEKLERSLIEIGREINYQKQKIVQVDDDLKNEGIERVHDQRGTQQKKEHLARILESRNKEKEKLESQCWEKEIDISRRYGKVEKVLSEYDDIYRNLQLEKKFVGMLQGQDIDLRFTHKREKKTNSSDFKERIKPILLDVQTKLSTEFHELEAQKITEEERFDQLNEICQDREGEIIQVDSKLNSLERDLESKKQLITLEQKNVEEGLTEIEREVQDLGQRSQIELEKKEEDVRKLRQRIEINQDKRNKEEKKARTFMMKVVNDVYEHKEIIEGAVEVTLQETIRDQEKLKEEMGAFKTFTNNILTELDLYTY